MTLQKMSILQQMLDTLKPYFEEDWDGEGARPITLGVVVRAVMLVESLPGVVMPVVSPIVDGSVGMFWDAKGIYLDLHVSAEGQIAFTYTLPDGTEKTKEFEEVPNSDIVEELRPTFGYICAERAAAYGLVMAAAFSAEGVKFESILQPSLASVA